MLLCALYTPMNKIKQQMNNNHNSGLYQVLQRDNSNRETKPLVGLSASHAVSEGHCGCAKAPLGSNAKSSDTFLAEKREFKGVEPKKVFPKNDVSEVIDEKTGEIKQVKKHAWGETEVLTPEQMLYEKFALQGSVRKLLPESRTAKCTRLTTGGEVAVLKSIKHNKSHYGGLQTCGSVWSCPVCSAKVSSRRREETLKAMEMHLSQGKSIYFITLTFPHYKQDSLVDLRKKQSEALKHYRKSYEFKKFVKESGYQGSIRALEVTFGLSNGWHPHTHEIVFCDNRVTFGSIKQKLFRAWYDACVKAGLPKPSYKNGIDVKGGDKAGEYVNKYGSELALGHAKKARNGRYSPYDLLRAYHHESDKQLGAKFVEFSEGMKGSRQLFWSPKLKSKFGINEMSDEDIARMQEDSAIDQGRITLMKWRAVVRYQHRATVLTLAQKHGFEVASQFIDGLFSKYVSSGDCAADDERKRKYIEKKNRSNPHHQSNSEVSLEDKFNQVKEALNRSENIKKQDAERRTHIEKSTMQWYFENMGDIDNPFNC